MAPFYFLFLFPIVLNNTGGKEPYLEEGLTCSQAGEATVLFMEINDFFGDGWYTPSPAQPIVEGMIEHLGINCSFGEVAAVSATAIRPLFGDCNVALVEFKTEQQTLRYSWVWKTLPSDLPKIEIPSSMPIKGLAELCLSM